MSNERLVHVNGVDLCVETFGEETAPAVLLIAGAAASMDSWDPELCRRVADCGRHVIRYDHRDTGGSTSYPPGKPGYSGADLRDDAYALIAALAGGRAHLVGLSMGGGIAQVLAAAYPDQVLSLTLMSTSPALPVGPEVELPEIADRLKAAFAHPAPTPDWSDDEDVVDYLVNGERLFAGPNAFDEERVRTRVRREVARTVNVESAATNHWLVAGGGESAHSFAEITMPTLVIHGTDDPLFPPGHGAALKGEIAGADLLLLDGVGHQPPPPSTWHLVIPAIAKITASLSSDTPLSALRSDS